jgi:hypothetical protein
MGAIQVSGWLGGISHGRIRSHSPLAVTVTIILTAVRGGIMEIEVGLDFAAL